MLKFIITVFCVILYIGLTHGSSKSDEKRSVLLLDAMTFPKIVPNPNRDVVVLVSLKSQFGDYGTDSIRSDYFNFAHRAQTEGDSDHVIFSQVIVNGAENKALSLKIGVGEDFLHPMMFIYPAGSETAIQYPETEPFHVSSLMQFATRHSSLQFQLPGTMKKFDEIASLFVRTNDLEYQNILILQAERLMDELIEPGENETAGYYIKIMRKIEEHGVEFLLKEIKRQQRIMNDASRLTKAGRRLIQQRLNVLHHFQASVNTIPTTTTTDITSSPKHEEF